MLIFTRRTERCTAVGLAVTLVAILAAAAAAQRFEAPPHFPNLPDALRGFQPHGETIGAALACGLRSERWANAYRGRLYEAMEQRQRGSAGEGAQIISAMEAYAERSVRRNRREYCPFAANSADLERGDRIVSGQERRLP